MYRSIGNKIKEERTILGLSREYFALKLDVSTQTIYKIETGERFGRTFVLYLSELQKLGVDLNNIFKSLQNQ